MNTLPSMRELSYLWPAMRHAVSSAVGAPSCKPWLLPRVSASECKAGVLLVVSCDHAMGLSRQTLPEQRRPAGVANMSSDG